MSDTPEGTAGGSSEREGEAIASEGPNRQTGRRWFSRKGLLIALTTLLVGGGVAGGLVASSNSPTSPNGQGSFTALLRKDGVTQAEITCSDDVMKGVSALLRAGANGQQQSAILLSLAADYGMNSQMYSIIENVFTKTYSVEFRTGIVEALATADKLIVSDCGVKATGGSTVASLPSPTKTRRYVYVPSFKTGESVKTIEALLSSTGLKWELAKPTRECLGRYPRDDVYETAPRPTTTVRRGSTVTILPCGGTSTSPTSTTSPSSLASQPPVWVGPPLGGPWKIGSPELVTAIDASLQRSAEQVGQNYTPIPSTYTVWTSQASQTPEWYFVAVAATSAAPSTGKFSGPVDQGEGLAYESSTGWQVATFGSGQGGNCTQGGSPSSPLIPSAIRTAFGC